MAEGNSRQGAAIIYLGTPTNPTLYAARVLQGPSEWQRVAIAFIATDPILRITLLGQAGGPGNTVEYDGIRFLPPGRNPVLLMAAVFARFLPHLTLDAASVAAAADRRNEWLFNGYIPDPGRTDALLTKMSQECFCTVFKDLDGIYRMTADDPDHAPVLHLESQHDVVLDSLEVQRLPMEQVYTDFYVWYQRVTTQVTTSQAGQYAAVIYVTPEASISQYSELQTLCQQAADALATRTRFDFYSDFIADPATADLLLSRLVRQLSVVRQDVTVRAVLPAVPLSVTDHVAVHAPLLGLAPFVGELRRAEMAFAAQPPGLAVSLTLRQSGLVRGVWEAWDVGALGDGPTESWPPGAPRVRETWPDEGGGPGSSRFPFAAWCPALLDIYTAPTIMVAALQGRASDPLPTEAAFWQTSSAAPANDDPWTPIDTAPGGGQGTALGLFANGERLCGTFRGTADAPSSSLWELGIAPGRPKQQLATLPPGLRATSTANFVNHALLGTAFGDIYFWDGATGEVAQVFTSFGGRVQTIRRLPSSPLTYEAWIESPDGLIIMRATAPDFLTWTPYTYANLTGTRCSVGIETYVLDTFHIVATGNEAGDRVDVWNLAPESAGTAVLMHTFFAGSGTPLHRPGPVRAMAGGRSAQHPYCYLGRVSLDETPMLELWGFDNAHAPQWQLLQDYATVPDPTYGLDTNQGITALFVSRQSRVLYVATGTPGGTFPYPGVRFYHYTPG